MAAVVVRSVARWHGLAVDWGCSYSPKEADLASDISNLGGERNGSAIRLNMHL